METESVPDPVVGQLPLSLTANPVFVPIASALQSQGWCGIPNAMPESICTGLYQQLLAMDSCQFEPAGVGRQQDHRHNALVRRDDTHWISGQTTAEQNWLEWMETLRLYLNEHLYLGLFGFESHFAHYPPEGFYQRHRDAFKGDTNRILSIVLFLNPNWRAEDGGALVLYQP
ncbi:MAG: 2OG-Fe(II) oxygenase, partial [Pseudohongiellaceae bacterium]